MSYVLPPLHCPECGRFGNEEDGIELGGECVIEECNGTIVSSLICQWYVLCDEHTIGVTTHPVLGEVPVCQRCVDRHGLIVNRFGLNGQPYEIDPECPVCEGRGIIVTGGPDYWGNYDTDDCICQTDPDFDPASYKEERDYP